MKIRLIDRLSSRSNLRKRKKKSQHPYRIVKKPVKQLEVEIAGLRSIC